MHVNPTARWAEENWSELRRFCCHELRTSFPQATRSDEIEDLFSDWLVDFIDKGKLDERLASGESISLRIVARFCLRNSLNRARQYGTDAHMRTRGFITETDRKKGICSKTSDRPIEQVFDDEGALHHVDPESAVSRLETRDELRKLAARVSERYEHQPQFIRCFSYLAEGLKRSEMNEREGRATNATVTRLRTYLREATPYVAASA